MKLRSIKQEVFNLTCTSNTKQLKKERFDLTNGRDLRYKEQWLEIDRHLKSLLDRELDISIVNLEESEKMLKSSLFKIGQMAGIDEDLIEIDWARIQLEVQFEDIHIEEL